MKKPVNVINDNGSIKAIDDSGTVATLAPTTSVLPDAPSDSLYYGRHNASWSAVVGEAPSDSQYYSRRNGAWSVSPAGLTDAPSDGNTYGRKNATWAVVPTQDPTIVQNSQSAGYTLVLSDNGKHIYHPSSDTTARTWTIPANSSVAFPIGSVVTFVNDTSGGAITIAITTDTLVLAGTGSTGSRTLAANGIATAMKVTSTRWIINGTNLT